MATLKPEYIEKIKEDLALQGAIAAATNKSFQTPARWAKGNNQEKLTTLTCLKTIAEYCKVSVDDLITDEVAA